MKFDSEASVENHVINSNNNDNKDKMKEKKKKEISHLHFASTLCLVDILFKTFKNHICLFICLFIATSNDFHFFFFMWHLNIVSVPER